MADNKQEPQFLGGGPKFNRAGAQPPDTEPATVTPAPAFRWRNLVIALVALLLIGLLYWITTGPNGLVHVGGHGGTSPRTRARRRRHSVGPAPARRGLPPMSALPPGPNSGGETDRVRCAYCGANNFPTATACWQCGRPLQPLRTGASRAAVALTRPAVPHASRPPCGGDPGLASKAAAALGLLFPGRACPSDWPS